MQLSPSRNFNLKYPKPIYGFLIIRSPLSHRHQTIPKLGVYSHLSSNCHHCLYQQLTSPPLPAIVSTTSSFRANTTASSLPMNNDASLLPTIAATSSLLRLSSHLFFLINYGRFVQVVVIKFLFELMLKETNSCLIKN